MAKSVHTDPETGLTPREQEVLCLIAIGLSNQEIAKRIGKSIRTYDSHRAGVINKLSLDNNVQVCLWALRNGWVDLDGNVLHVVGGGVEGEGGEETAEGAS